MGTKTKFGGSASWSQCLNKPTGCRADVWGVEWVGEPLRARCFLVTQSRTQPRVQLAAPIWEKGVRVPYPRLVDVKQWHELLDLVGADQFLRGLVPALPLHLVAELVHPRRTGGQSEAPRTVKAQILRTKVTDVRVCDCSLNVPFIIYFRIKYIQNNTTL